MLYSGGLVAQLEEQGDSHPQGRRFESCRAQYSWKSRGLHRRGSCVTLRMRIAPLSF
jgi:hypothetical protein